MTIGKNYVGDTKLSFDDHINQVTNKATKMKKIICRTFLQFLDRQLKMRSCHYNYKTMVRTHLDYAIAVGYPLKKRIIAIENVQKRATKELSGMRNLTYREQIKSPKLLSLAQTFTR